MNKKYILICLLLYLIPVLPYFVPNEITFGASRVVYIIWFITNLFLCLGFALFLIYIIITPFFLVLDNADPSYLKKNIKRLSIIGILLLFSFLGYFTGELAYEYLLFKRMDKVVKTTIEFDENNFDSTKLLDMETKLKDIEAKHLRVKNLKLETGNEDCLLSFNTPGTILFDDGHCHYKCCRVHPTGVPYKLRSRSQGNYNWYRFCYN